MDASPTKTWLIAHQHDAAWKWHVDTAFAKRPGEELYDLNIASMEGVKSWYNQSDATGFIRLNGLRLRARSLAQGGPKV